MIYQAKPNDYANDELAPPESMRFGKRLNSDLYKVMKKLKVKNKTALVRTLLGEKVTEIMQQ